MRRVIAPLVSIVLFVTSAFAGTNTNGPLAPGKPAGVKQADLGDDTLLYIVGIGAVIAGIAIIASDNGNGHGSVSGTTTGTQ